MSSPQRTTLAAGPQLQSIDAIPLRTLQAKSQEPPAQANASAPQAPYFTFQGVPQTNPFEPPSQPFTFEAAGPTYPAPALASSFSQVNPHSQSISTTMSDFESHLENLNLLDREFDEVQNQYCELRHEFELLREQSYFHFESGKVLALKREFEGVENQHLKLLHEFGLLRQPSDSDFDLEKVLRLERQVNDLQNQCLKLRPQVEYLRQQEALDEQERSSSPLPDPGPPAIDHEAEIRCLQREKEKKQTAAEQAHNDAKRTEVEVNLQKRRDEIVNRRREWWDKSKERAALPPRILRATPARIAAAAKSFTTGLNLLAQRPRHRPVVATTPPLSPLRVPLPRSPEQNDGNSETYERQPSPTPRSRGILRQPADDSECNQSPTLRKSVQFGKIVTYVEDGGDDK